MNNNIRDSWDKVSPSEKAESRMLNRLLDRVRDPKPLTTQRRRGLFAKKSFFAAACFVLALTMLVSFMAIGDKRNNGVIPPADIDAPDAASSVLPAVKRVLVSACVPEPGQNGTFAEDSAVYDGVPGGKIGEEYVSPLLLEKLEEYRGQDVWFRVIVGLPVTGADRGAYKPTSAYEEYMEELTAKIEELEPQTELAKKTFEKALAEESLKYEKGLERDTFIEKFKADFPYDPPLSEKLKAAHEQYFGLLEKQGEYIRALSDCRRESETAYYKAIRDDRYNFIINAGAENLSPVACYYLPYSDYYAELTEGMINSLIEKGGYVLRLAPPERAEGYSEKISDYLTARLAEMPDGETVCIQALTKADRGYRPNFRLILDSGELSALQKADEAYRLSPLKASIAKDGTDSEKMSAVKEDLLRFEETAAEMRQRAEEISKAQNAVKPVDYIKTDYKKHPNGTEQWSNVPVYSDGDKALLDKLDAESAKLRGEWAALSEVFKQRLYDYIDAALEDNGIADKRIDTSERGYYCPADVYFEFYSEGQMPGHYILQNVKFEAELTKAEILRLARNGDIYEIDFALSAYEYSILQTSTDDAMIAVY